MQSSQRLQVTREKQHGGLSPTDVQLYIPHNRMEFSTKIYIQNYLGIQLKQSRVCISRLHVTIIYY